MEKSNVKKKRSLEDLFHDPLAVDVHHTLMHQAFQIPGAGTESSLNPSRPGLRELKMVYHPEFGLIGFMKGKYFLAPSHNVIVAHE